MSSKQLSTFCQLVCKRKAIRPPIFQGITRLLKPGAKGQKHTTAGIRWSSPTQLLIRPLSAYLWESGRDPEFSDRYGHRGVEKSQDQNNTST
ncbi:hypothetical protein LB504_006479 [Fusarium proliferatum]|nr:hypothetical protein LB504_006479 [Fusarium proliferatum]